MRWERGCSNSTTTSGSPAGCGRRRSISSRAFRCEAAMTEPADLLLVGSGGFAARIAFDIAATATSPIRVVIAGRNAVRRDWLRVAANARAANFGLPAFFRAHAVDLSVPDAADEAILAYRPKVVVQAATTQTSAVISGQNDA